MNTTNNSPITDASKNKVVLYTDKRGDVELRADVERDTLWASQIQIARLFNVNPQAIVKHLKNIYRSGELNRNPTSSKMELVQIEGGRATKRLVEFYNLDAIIAVGYRVNSRRATRFRIWATRVLREYLVNGFAIRQKKLAGPEQNFDNLQEALTFMESGSRGGPLRAKMTVRLSKNLLP